MQSEMALEAAYYQIEIGNSTYDENDNVVFNAFCWSDNKEASSFVDGKDKYTPGSIEPSYPTGWVPEEFYTINPVIPTPSVPEPNTILLFTIGSGLLLLRRKLS